MKNLWLFLVRYNAFFWFVLFFTFSIFLVVQNNNYQRSSFVNSSNVIIGSFYENVNSWKEYLSLRTTNEQLAEENALLRQQLQNIMSSDSTTEAIHFIDSIDESRYDFLVASVVNNSVNQKSNYLTIDKGTIDGIEKDMGVITSNGVVGTVLNVSAHFSTVKSLLHPDSKISVTLDSSSTAFGSLVWGNNKDPRYAMVRDIPNHVKVYVGQPVFTSGYSTKFPKGIKIGHIVQTDLTSGESFKDIRVLLTTNFVNLNHVYIVKDKMAIEKMELERQNKDNG
ncbi:rod shape-determining protein MreC [Sphingobacterium nematocida]|uniref:Cell shape-determining protein MreC n=1 Tax=Sphingobacterium nematocida TaxID=1513896 RepID=A0A1T5CN13_9SPHI|nr:rod shape-determining protein MreC [Sphingobacterium nematocida]SKB60827.1 rod shape-determining protein MreC [Sphingobacterium nematocida]